MSEINYWEQLTEKQQGMLDALKPIYNSLPVHFYPYSFSICPNRHIAGFFGFFNIWWAIHNTYYPMNDKSVSLYEVIDKKYADYRQVMGLEGFERIEDAIIKSIPDIEVDKLIGSFYKNKEY